MKKQNKQGLVLDPRTKIVIWLLANVIVFGRTPMIFCTTAMILYAVLFWMSGKGRAIIKLGILYSFILVMQYLILPVLPSILATIFTTITYLILIFPCIVGGAYLLSTTSVSQFMAALRRWKVPENFVITMAVTLRFLPALRQDILHIRDAMSLRKIKSIDQKLEGIYIPMLMGVAKTAEELSESATARGIEYPGQKTTWHSIGFQIQDGIVTGAFLALCIGGFLLKGVWR